MMRLGKSEDTYADIPVRQRARMIAAMKLPGMIDALNQNREHERLKRKAANAN